MKPGPALPATSCRGRERREHRGLSWDKSRVRFQDYGAGQEVLQIGSGTGPWDWSDPGGTLPTGGLFLVPQVLHRNTESIGKPDTEQELRKSMGRAVAEHLPQLRLRTSHSTASVVGGKGLGMDG